jgi:hypothetical protein
VHPCSCLVNGRRRMFIHDQKQARSVLPSLRSEPVRPQRHPNAGLAAIECRVCRHPCPKACAQVVGKAVPIPRSAPASARPDNGAGGEPALSLASGADLGDK